MFGWVNHSDEIAFRKHLSANPWLKTFLLRYLFAEGYVYFDKKIVARKIGKFSNDKEFRKNLLKHIKEKREEMVTTDLSLQSFQYLDHIICKLRKYVRKHYDIILPYLIQLNKKDLPFIVDILMGKFKLKAWQIQILKGGL